MKRVYLIIILLTPGITRGQFIDPLRAVGEQMSPLDAVEQFNRQTAAEAQARAAAAAGNLGEWTSRSQSAFAAMRKRHRLTYATEPPLQDYSRVDRAGVEALLRHVEQMNRDKLDRHMASEKDRFEKHLAAEKHRDEVYQTQADIYFLQQKQFNAVLESDEKVWRDGRLYHSRPDCPFCLAGQEIRLSQLTLPCTRCLLCQPPLPRKDRPPLPPLQAAPVPPQPREVVSHPFPVTREGEDWSLGRAVLLDRFRCSGRRYDVYFAATQEDGLFALRWVEWDRLSETDQKEVVRILTERPSRPPGTKAEPAPDVTEPPRDDAARDQPAA